MSDTENGNSAMAETLDELLKEWTQTLPREFTLGTVGNGSSGVPHRYPDLHFKADEHIPGRYYAALEIDEHSRTGNGSQGLQIEIKGDPATH